MKKLFAWSSLGVLVALLAVGLIACNQDSDVLRPAASEPEVATSNIGQVHTEVLTRIHAGLDAARAAKGGELDKAMEDQVLVDVVNRLTDKYGIARMTPAEILGHVERGRQMARQDPVALMASVLDPTEMLWWDRFASEATISDAALVYKKHCRLHGTPDANSRLGRVMSLTISSAEYWDNYRGDQEPVYQNAFIPQDKGWKKWLRFAVNVVVDGAAGGTAGAGAAMITGGLASGVVGGLVGGLASHGADDMLFG